MNGLIVLGTASDSGKTMICTALCRILSDEWRTRNALQITKYVRFSACNGKWRRNEPRAIHSSNGCQNQTIDLYESDFIETNCGYEIGSTFFRREVWS